MQTSGKIDFFILLMVPYLFGESGAIVWTGSLQDGDVLNTCRQADATFAWQYQADGGDVVSDVQWYFSGRSQEVIAMFTHGYFQDYPAFSGRVSRVGNAGLVLSSVLAEDSGNYTVVVKGHNANGHYFELNSTVVVDVSDQMMNQNGDLEVSQTPQPVKDTATDKWAIQLECGAFKFPGQPTYDVQWINPFGHLKSSSSFDGVNFKLLLTSPIQGGYYTCRIPHQNACLNGQGLVSTEASILVDALEARLTLLEKVSDVDIRQLKADKERLQRKLNETVERLEELQEREQQDQNETDTQLETVTSELDQMNKTIAGLGSEGPIRLVGGNDEMQGRVELRVGNRWGTICDDNWDSSDAKVVCNMLGFFKSGAIAKTNAFFGRGTGPILMKDVGCRGTEKDIRVCSSSDFGVHDCNHGEDAGVICAGY